MVNGWKITAIIFIILFVLAAGTIFYFISAGTKMIENESECSMNICQGGGYDAYFYDDYNKMCYCYMDKEIVYQEYIT